MQHVTVLVRVLGFAAAMICATAQAESRVVTSLKELSSLGIAVERMQLSTPMASVEVGALIDPEKTPGQYELTECVVLESGISIEKLAEVDAAAIGVARRSESTKVRSVFLVRGKEVPNAYLAFQFSVRADGGPQTRRYLLPVAKLAN